MEMVARLGGGLGLFLGSMAAGWWLSRRGLLREEQASRLVRWVIKVLAPLVLCLTFWKMDLRRVEPWLLPLLGVVISTSTLLPAWAYARSAGLSRPQIGSFLTCALFSNVGYMGAFTAFALFGEAAYALCVLYFMLFTPTFYTLGFGIAAHYGRRSGARGPAASASDALRLYPFLGMVAGVLLSLFGPARPAGFERLNHALIPVDTALYLLAIGSQLTFESPRLWWRPCVAMCGIKFLYTPLVAWLLVSGLRLEGLPRLMVLLEASTPVAVSPLVLPLLFGLDRRFANALWVVTTAAAIPWLLFVIPLLQRL
jgi:predicted permease